MKQTDLQKFVLENPKLVTMKETSPGLFVLKYKRNVFYDNLWNDYLEECRGTIVDKDFNVISRPFTKIYNYGVEARSPKLADDVRVAAFRKVNGFMVAVTWHNGDILVSTTGSTDSPFVTMARELLDLDKAREVCSEYKSYTFMFECVHRDDPHIVPEVEGMYLLGHRANTWNSEVSSDPTSLDLFADRFGAFRVESFNLRMDDLVKMSKVVRHEGFVAYTACGQSFKIKSPYYLVKKWMARNPRTDKLLTKEFKEQIDEEYYGLLSYIRENITEYTLLSEQSRLRFIEAFLTKINS